VLDPGERPAFRVRGLGPGEVEDGPRRFRVSVKGADVPLLGEYSRRDGELVFEPQFPLRPGLEYRAVFEGRVERTFAVPAPPAGAPTVVRQVHPSRATLPENLLKFYLHFSAPMSRGEAYRRVHLVEASGREVELPFLELGEELWDPTGTRLTLFFDPGRIKRGLKPREEAGPALEEGKSYTLVVDREWRDATGQPLGQGYRKAFRAGPPDDVQPDPKKWKIQPPRAGTREPLAADLDEPLDAALLARSLVVRDAAGKVVSGRVEIDREETRWRFYPDGAWARGPHTLEADLILEDLAGNSIGRPFEVDAVRPVERRPTSGVSRLAFTVP
jgi:hypothetical protein